MILECVIVAPPLKLCFNKATRKTLKKLVAFCYLINSFIRVTKLLIEVNRADRASINSVNFSISFFCFLLISFFTLLINEVSFDVVSIIFAFDFVKMFSKKRFYFICIKNEFIKNMV